MSRFELRYAARKVKIRLVAMVYANESQGFTQKMVIASMQEDIVTIHLQP